MNPRRPPRQLRKFVREGDEGADYLDILLALLYATDSFTPGRVTFQGLDLTMNAGCRDQLLCRLVERWGGVLAGVDVWAASHCDRLLAYARIDCVHPQRRWPR